MKTRCLIGLFILSSSIFSCMNEEKPVQASETETEPISFNETTVDTATLGIGGKLYFANCNVCHGPDGKKKYQEAKDLSISRLSMEARIHIISAAQVIGNKEHTPRWEPILNEEEIYLVAQYIDSLKN